MARKTCAGRLTVETKRRLWADSAGYCGNPACAQYVFAEDADVDFGELAHVIPASVGGPRDVPQEEKSAAQRAHHSNVIVLCANCHTTVDKAPGAYPADMLRSWKAQRTSTLKTAVGTPRFESRRDARSFVEPLLDENRTVHSEYGPVGDPYSDGKPEMWVRQARLTIVPNNRRLLDVLEANRALLTDAERATLATFRQHVRHFEDRHLLDDFTPGAERFPVELEAVFADEEGVA